MKKFLNLMILDSLDLTGISNISYRYIVFIFTIKNKKKIDTYLKLLYIYLIRLTTSIIMNTAPTTPTTPRHPKDNFEDYMSDKATEMNENRCLNINITPTKLFDQSTPLTPITPRTPISILSGVSTPLTPLTPFFPQTPTLNRVMSPMDTPDMDTPETINLHRLDDAMNRSRVRTASQRNLLDAFNNTTSDSDNLISPKRIKTVNIREEAFRRLEEQNIAYIRKNGAFIPTSLNEFCNLDLGNQVSILRELNNILSDLHNEGFDIRELRAQVFIRLIQLRNALGSDYPEPSDN